MNYVLFGINLEAQPLHKLTAELTDKILTHHTAQDLLLNEGCEIEERPHSMLCLHDGTWIASEAKVHLALLEHTIDLATRPQLMIARMDTIITPESRAWAESPQGYDLEQIEKLQKEWLQNPEMPQAARELKHHLGNAVREFNLKFTLNRMRHAKRHPCLEGEMLEIQERIKEVFTPEAYTALDNAYYNAGVRHFRRCAEPYEKLKGTVFCMTREEAQHLIIGLRADALTYDA